MELGDIDLNLLVLFQRLMEEQRVSSVAEKMNMSQPGVSNALAKLRRLLDDPLFVRGKGGIVPTPLAMQLARPVAQALSTLHSALNTATTKFDPLRAERTMTIGMSDIGEVVFLPALVEHLMLAAPGIALNSVRNVDVSLSDEMANGGMDLAIGLLPELRGGFHRRRLFRQRYVCLFRLGHALDGAPLMFPAWRDAEHLVVVSAETGHSRVNEWLRTLNKMNKGAVNPRRMLLTCSLFRRSKGHGQTHT